MKWSWLSTKYCPGFPATAT